MKVSSIECRRLKKLIRKGSGSCLIVDCRPYFSFSASCIRGSLNVNLNSVVVRRARGGPVPLQFVIPDPGAQCRLRDGVISLVVAVDDRTPHWQKIKKDSAAQIVISTLLDVSSGAKICFLKARPRSRQLLMFAVNDLQSNKTTVFWKRRLEGFDRIGGLMGQFTSVSGKNRVWGYESFHSQYPELCTELKVSSMDGSEPEKAYEKLATGHKPTYDQGQPAEILPFLFLGSAYHASRQDYLKDLHITALLNVSQRATDHFKGQVHYKWIPVEDSHTADISSHFKEAIEFIDCVRQGGGKVLVHCEAGISRSPTICMAYIMKTKKMCLEDAFDFIKQRRSLISPNFGFMGQLLQYESEALSTALRTPDALHKRDGVSFLSEDFSLNQNYEGSVFAFPASFRTPVPLQTSVNPITLSSSITTSP
ncbi:DUS5 phosphatase, partial [Polypterus senegalus]|nr:DUS5 phosphatase [Polypterus senegalus]